MHAYVPGKVTPKLLIQVIEMQAVILSNDIFVCARGQRDMMRDAASHQNAAEQALTDNTQLQEQLSICRKTLQDMRKEKVAIETTLQKLQRKISVLEEDAARVGDGCEKVAQITEAAERVLSGTQTMCYSGLYVCVHLYIYIYIYHGRAYSRVYGYRQLIFAWYVRCLRSESQLRNHDHLYASC